MLGAGLPDVLEPVLKFKMSEESGQAAELNSYHSDIDRSFGAGRSSFVITDQSALTHQPAKGALHDPASRQHFETRGSIGTFDNLDRQFGAKLLDPLSEGFAGIATIDPQDAEPSEPAQYAAQDYLRASAFGGAGRRDGNAEHQPQGVHQQMALAAFDPLAGVIAYRAAVTVGLDALAVENGGRGPRAFVLSSTDERAQRVVEGGPLVVERPLPEAMIDGLPRRKVGRQITPRTATFDDIQDGIEDAPPIRGWASALGGFGQHRFEVSPLGVREAAVIYGVFHALTEAALKMNRLNPRPMSTHHCIILPLTSKPITPTSTRNPNFLIIQTAT